MGHLRYFGLNNFRVFNTETDFELRPITILTGTNSSGKSSMIKGLQILKNIFANIPYHEGIGRKGDQVVFDSLFYLNLAEINNLGGFSIVKSNKTENNIISFKAPFMLPSQFSQMTLHLDYQSDGTTLENAELNELKVTLKDEQLLLYQIKIVNNNWEFYVNAKELYKLLRNFRTTEQEFNKLIHSRRNDSTSETDIKKEIKENPDLNLKLKSISPELHYKYIINKPFISFDNDTFAFKREHPYLNDELGVDDSFLPQGYLFPFLFIYKKEFIDKEVKSKYESSEISSFRERFENLTDEEKKQFSTEYLETEYNILDKLYSHYKMVNLSETKNFWYIFQFLNGTEIIGNLAHAKILLKMSKDKVQDILNSKNDYHKNLINDFNSFFNEPFFKKHKITEEFLILKPRKDSAFNKNLKYFFEDFCKLGFRSSLEDLSECYRSMNFVPNIRSHLGRIYHQNNTSYMNDIITEFHKTKIRSSAKEFLNKYVKEFKIADEVSINYEKDSQTSKIIFFKNNIRTNIADLGYGISQLLPILLRIAINISLNEEDPEVRLQGGGVGTMELTPSILVIEEPETNLHPALQSKLADLFVECYQKYNIQFIVETHSEYFIRKLQYKVAKEEFNHKDANIYYFNDPESEDYKSEVVYKINIEKDGILSRPFGPGFYDESNLLNLSLRLLIKDSLN